MTNHSNNKTQRNKITKISKQIIGCLFVMACMNNSASAMFARLKPLGDDTISLGTRYLIKKTFQARSFVQTTTLPIITTTYEAADKARPSPFKNFSLAPSQLKSFETEFSAHLQATKEMGAISNRHSLYENFEVSLLRDEARTKLLEICEIPTDTPQKIEALKLFINIHKRALPFMDKADLANAFRTSLSHEELPMQFIETLFSTEIPDYLNIGHDDISHVLSEARRKADQARDDSRRITQNDKLNIIQKWAEMSPATQRAKLTGTNSNIGC